MVCIGPLNGTSLLMRSTTATIHIKANARSKLSFRELWLFRELFYFFAWRDIKVRYKQTIIGVAWAVLQPVLATGVFTIFLNKVAGIRTEGVPYAVFAYLGMLYWTTFSSGLNMASNSMVASQSVLTKVYFPRIIAPLSSVAVSVIDFMFATSFFVLLLVVYKIVPSAQFLLLIFPALLLTVLTSFGVGTFFAALNVKYRDVRTGLPFLTQILFFGTPIIYPISLIPDRLQTFVYLNPMAGAIEMVRGSLFHQPINWNGVTMSCVSMVLALIIGVRYFKRVEKGFADII